MVSAICFNCGSEKLGAFSVCRRCEITPQTRDELLLSLALSTRLSSESQLAHFAHETKSGLRPSIPKSLLDQAGDVLNHFFIKEKTGVEREDAQVAAARMRPAQTATVQKQVIPDICNLKATALHKNAFCLLGATTRDNRRKLVKLAEDRSLELDHDACQKARSDMTNPRTRLGVEMAWLPGVSPRKAEQLASQLLQNPMSIRTESGLPSLAHANLMAAAFESVGDGDNPEDISEFIQEMAYLVDEITINDIIRDINEDRAISEFPEIGSRDQVESELTERKHYFKNAIKNSLNSLSPMSLVDVMTWTVDSVTNGGEDHAPELIDQLVDSYEVEAQGFLQKEAENIHKLINAVRDSAVSGEGVVKPLVDKLETITRNWDRVAQPIQLSAKARGIEHELSNEMAHSIRNLAIELFNEYNMLTQSKRITDLLRELFSELPDVAEQVEQDADVLQGIFQSRKQEEAIRNEWAKEITYHAEIGLVFKNTLSISPDGVVWNNMSFPLDTITRVRWGGVNHSVNGIPTGTTYTLAFGDDLSEAVIELRREDVYSTFIDKLWRAVCIRLLTDSLESLRAGKEIKFGRAILRDDGVTLIKHKFWGLGDAVRCAWHQTHIWSSGGDFYIGLKDDKKTYVSLSYINTPNTHVVEQMIRMGFNKAGMRKLSDVLQGN